MTAPCHGCHGTGNEPSGTTYAGLAEQLACDECGPDCPQDCGCRVDAEPEGATNSPSGNSRTPQGLNGPQNRSERVTDAEAAEWAALAERATEGPWVVDSDGSIGAPMAGFVCGEDGHPRLDCPDCGLRVGGSNSDDTAFIAAARTAVPRLLAEREALRAALAEARTTIANLNRRAQVAEAALHELTTGTGGGKAKRVAREVWERCQESHGLVCATTGRARAEVDRMREGADETPNEPGVWASPAQMWARLLSLSPALRLAWIEAMQKRAQQHVDPDGLSADRDRARDFAARVEAENARLVEEAANSPTVTPISFDRVSFMGGEDGCEAIVYAAGQTLTITRKVRLVEPEWREATP